MLKTMSYEQTVRYLKEMESMVESDGDFDFSYLESELNINETELEKIIHKVIQNVTSDDYHVYKYMEKVINDIKNLYTDIKFKLDDDHFKEIHGSILDLYRKHIIDLSIDLIDSHELEVSKL